MGLTSVLRGDVRPGDQVTVLDREPNLYATTFPSEIVTCRLPAGSRLRLFCKYGPGHRRENYGHRGGLAYEAAVYRRVLQPLHIATPAFYGEHTDVTSGDTWLVLEYLEDSIYLHWVPGPDAMGSAARWIGRFHAANEARLSSARMPFLNRYDVAYYVRWARRTSRFAGDLHERYPWLVTVCGRYEELVDLLIAQPMTIVHGDYYSQNVLFRRGAVYPTDWELAALAVGEIDLASLTDRWSAEIVRHCRLEYQQARWPQGPPTDSEQTIDVARLYLHFRALGHRPDRATDERHLWRFEQLRSTSERLGLI